MRRNEQVLKESERYFKIDKGKPVKQAVSGMSTDDLNAQAKEIHKGRSYAELSLEERVDLLVLFWKTSLIEWDPDSTALMHETYKNDPVLYNTVLMIDTFIAHLENLKG